MSPEKPDALLWMDVETTGLDTNKCSILEIGLRCTSMDAMMGRDIFQISLEMGMTPSLFSSGKGITLFCAKYSVSLIVSCISIKGNPRNALFLHISGVFFVEITQNYFAQRSSLPAGEKGPDLLRRAGGAAGAAQGR